MFWSTPGADDFGTKIRIKCHQPIKRKQQTLEGELCMNWKLIDSFGVQEDFENSINHTNVYKNFYNDPNEAPWRSRWDSIGIGL